MLVDVILPLLCMNATLMKLYECPGDENYPKTYGLSEYRRYRLKVLSSELAKEHLTITTTENPPLSYVERNGSRIEGRGNAFDFLDIFRAKHTFNYTLLVPEEKSLALNENGVINLLHKNKADFAVAFLPAVSMLKGVIEFSRALDEGEWVVLMKRPQESATGSGLWAPFTLEVWLMTLLSLLIVGPIIYGLIVLEVKLCRDDNYPLYPLPACVWFVYGALLKQGSTLSPISDSSRMLFATWWIFITILTAFYTANLTAFLTLSKFTLPINKAEDIGQKHYAWVAHQGGLIDELMKHDDTTFKMKIKGSKYAIVDENGANIMKEWVDRKNYMYITDKVSVEQLMYNDYREKSNVEESQRCTFVISTWKAVTISRAFAYREGFKYAELFDDVIQHLFESGIVKHKLRENLPNTPICPLNLGSKERQLRNSDLFMTYVLVGAGFIVATCIFIGEFAVRACGKQEQRPHNNFNNFMTENHILRKNKHAGNFKFATFADNKNVKGTLWHEMDQGENPPPPPPYHALFQPPYPNTPNATKKTINGRDYWIVNTVFGETKLIPVRTPSALLFQYDQRH